MHGGHKCTFYYYYYNLQSRGTKLNHTITALLRTLSPPKVLMQRHELEGQGGKLIGSSNVPHRLSYFFLYLPRNNLDLQLQLVTLCEYPYSVHTIPLILG